MEQVDSSLVFTVRSCVSNLTLVRHKENYYLQLKVQKLLYLPWLISM